MVSQRDIIKKVDMLVSDLAANGGILQQEQNQAFVRTMQTATVLLGRIRRVDMVTPSMAVNKIILTGPVLRPAVEGSGINPSDRVSPTTSQVELDTKKFMASIYLTYEDLSDSIEKGNFESTVMALLAEATGRDLESLAIHGNVNRVAGDTGYNGETLSAAEAKLYKQFNGMIAKCTSNVVDFTSDSLTMQKEILKQMYMTMPVAYQRTVPNQAYLMSYNNENEYADYVADRPTVVGDSHLLEYSPIRYNSVPLVPVGLWPDTYAMLSDPRNMIYGVYKDIMVEREKDIDNQIVKFVLSLRIALQVEETNAMVLGSGIVSPTA